METGGAPSSHPSYDELGRQDQTGWAHVQAIFAQVVDLPPEQQLAAVHTMCAGDEQLANEVLELLQEDRQEHPLLDADLASFADDVLKAEAVRSLVQQQIGPYRLIRLLGEGGMGVVYLAERTDIGGHVAIKLLRDAWFSPMRRQRFLAEQRMLARLHHPGIAHIYDVGTMVDGTPWFVMEYADGLPLTEWLRVHEVNFLRALLLFRKVCEAVQHAHELAIIHRDLKPSNILITAAGEVKLLDFGIAKELEPEGEEATRTLDGLRLMSPAVGVFTDVYALGVMFYEILTGHVPTLDSSGKRPQQPSLAGRTEAWFKKPLSRHQWAELDLICATALQEDPGRRYRSVDMLGRDIDAYLDGRPLQVRRDGWVYLAHTFVRRHSRPLLAVACGLLLFVAMATIFTVRLAQARNAAVAETARLNRILDFTETLFDGGYRAAGPPVNLKVIEVLDRGKKEAASLGSDPALQADLQTLLGTAYGRLGQMATADQLLEQAVNQRRGSSEADDHDYAKSLVMLGSLRKDERRMSEAEDLLRKAIAIEGRRKHERDDTLEHAHAVLGSVLALEGKYPAAQTELQMVLSQRPANEAPTEQFAADLTQLAEVDHYLGAYPEAERLNRQAMAINIALLGKGNPAVAENLTNLGSIAQNWAHYGEAEQLQRQALALQESWYGPNHPVVAETLAALSTSLISSKKLDGAEAALQRALAIQIATYGGRHASVALTYNELGTLAYIRDFYDAAEKNFQSALEIWKQVYGDTHPFVGVAYANLSGVYLHQKDYRKAEQACRQALAVYAVATPGENNNAAVAHVKLGRALLRQRRFADAEKESMLGYRYFLRTAAPDSTYLTGVRKDLAETELALGHPELRAQYLASAAR